MADPMIPGFPGSSNLFLFGLAGATYAAFVLPSARSLAVVIAVMTSNPDGMRTSAEAWVQVGKSVDRMREELVGAATPLSDERWRWEGDDRKAFEGAFDAHMSDLERAARGFEGIGGIVDVTAKVNLALAFLAATAGAAAAALALFVRLSPPPYNVAAMTAAQARVARMAVSMSDKNVHTFEVAAAAALALVAAAQAYGIPATFVHYSAEDLNSMRAWAPARLGNQDAAEHAVAASPQAIRGLGENIKNEAEQGATVAGHAAERIDVPFPGFGLVGLPLQVTHDSARKDAWQFLENVQAQGETFRSGLNSNAIAWELGEALAGERVNWVEGQFYDLPWPDGARVISNE